jgi:hypothetical protein
MAKLIDTSSILGSCRSSIGWRDLARGFGRAARVYLLFAAAGVVLSVIYFATQRVALPLRIVGLAVIIGLILLRARPRRSVSVVSEYWQTSRDTLQHTDLQRELAAARRMQGHLVKSRCPMGSRIEFAAATIPLHEIAGDYIDYVQRTDGRIVFALVDAPGKGVPAALAMVMIQSAFRAAAVECNAPADILTHLSRKLTAPIGRFGTISVFCAMVDPQTLMLQYSNAGALCPVLVHLDGVAIGLREAGPPLGQSTELSYEQETVLLQPGDKVICCTKGASDSGFLAIDDRRPSALSTALMYPEMDAGALVEELQKVLTTRLEHGIAVHSQPTAELSILVLRATP